MPKVTHPHLERRPTGYYFRRRLPACLFETGANPAGQPQNQESNSNHVITLSLKTYFLPEAKRRARRLTAASDALFAARTEQDMPISAEIMTALLREVRDHEISAFERVRARSAEREPVDVDAALSREAAVQDALREAIALGRRETAAPLLKAAARRLGVALDETDPDFSALGHHATRLLIEISAERARREVGDYGSESVLDSLGGGAKRPDLPTFQSRRTAGTAEILKTAFGQAKTDQASFLPPMSPPLPAQEIAAIRSGTLLHGAFGGTPYFSNTAMPPVLSAAPPDRTAPVQERLVPHLPVPAPSASPVEAAPTHPSLILPAEPEARRRAMLRAIPDLRIDKSLFSDASLEALLDPWNMTIGEAFDAYVEVKLAGYKDEFHKTQKRLPGAGKNFTKNTLPSMRTARRLWCDLLGNCRLKDVTNDRLDEALQLLGRLPVLHGKVYKADTTQGIIDLADAIEIEQEAAASRAIDDNPTLSEAEKDDLLIKAVIPRLRVETYLKHGRAMGRIGRFLEGLGLIPFSPFGLCSWTEEEEETMRANEATKAREPWDDRLYVLFRTPVFQGHWDGPGDPLFWAPLISVLNGPRMEEILQLAPEDFGVEGGIAYFRISNRAGNNVKSTSSERKIPIHPSLIALGLLDLVEMRRREGAARLFPNLGKGETKGTRAELFTKAFGYYRKTNGVYWPGLDFHALRTTFHSFLLNSDRVSDARRRRLMGHSPVDEGEKSYAQGLRMSALLADVETVEIDVSMIQSPFAATNKVVSLDGTRKRISML